MSRAIEVAVNVARGVGGAAEAVARALRLGAARLAAARFRSARLIVSLTDPAANGAHRARVLAPAVRRLHRALGHRSGGPDEPDIRAAGDTKDAAAAKASARDLQDGLAVDIERAAALLTARIHVSPPPSSSVADAAPPQAHRWRQRTGRPRHRGRKRRRGCFRRHQADNLLASDAEGGAADRLRLSQARCSDGGP